MEYYFSKPRGEVGGMRCNLIPIMAFLALLQTDVAEHKPIYSIGASMISSDYSYPGCPAFVGYMFANSPAARAGIHLGDVIISVDGQPVHDLSDVAKHLSPSPFPGKVTVGLARGETTYRVTMEREEYAQILEENGVKLVDGLVVDLDTTDAEIEDRLEENRALASAIRSGDRRVIFTDRHYPENKMLYYPGFEVFVWDHETQVTVGGLENGPARRSGVRSGDHIVAVNGIDIVGKSDAAIEGALSSPSPKSIVLTIARAGARKTFTFGLERADAVLHENHLQVVHGKTIPDWITQKYMPCFVQ